jgi:hypothetical protein
MSIHAFVGPSLPKKLRKHYADLGINFHPPLGQADLISHIEWSNNDDIILIADGYYKDIPSTWHKEILYAIKKGFRVIGCSSIGAMRAMECELYGMEGHGSVYQWFKQGLLYDDSDVALLHDTVEFNQLTIPICDVLATLKSINLDDKTINYFCNLIRQIHFEDRTINFICDHFRSNAKRVDANLIVEICDKLTHSLVRQKQLDIESALDNLLSELYVDREELGPTQKVSELSKGIQSQKCEKYELNQTVFFDGLMYLDRPIHSKTATLLSTRSSYLNASVVLNPDLMKTLETESMLVKVSALLFDHLKSDFDCKKYQHFKSEYIAYIRENGWNEQLQRSSGLTDEEINDYIQDRFKATLLLGNIHRFHPYASACKSFFSHSLLNPEHQQNFHDFKKLLDSMAELSVDPITEASESDLPTWSNEIVSQILSSYVKSQQGNQNFGIGSFLDFDTTAAMQRIIRNYRHEMIRFFATKVRKK